jgi:glycosyltransferase involved in cell wall biosynthesis
MADVTVVVPSFEQGRFLERCLASIVGQVDVDVELIVIDAVSADETGVVLDDWRSMIDVIVVERDEGQADAIAKGIRRSSAPVITWLNADDAYAGPNALRTLVDWLDRRSDVDLVYGRRVWIDGAGGFVRLDRWQPFDEATFRLACFLPQECAVFRRDAYERAGEVDPSFSFALDYDLWLRMLDRGSRFLSIPPVVGLFRVHSDQKTTARWRDVGLVEIARLHRRHLGREVAEDEMLAAADHHRNGTSVTAAYADRLLGADLTAIFNGHLASLLRGRPLDRWGLAVAGATPLDRLLARS